MKQFISKDCKVMAWCVLVLCVLAAGCGTTKQGRGYEKSGFLGDYSNLREGDRGEAQLVYVNEAADFSNYKKVIIDPVVIYAAEDSKLNSLPQKDLKAMVDYLDATLRDSLLNDYRIVQRPDAETMRLRVAITEAKGANVVLNPISTIVPQGRAISLIKSLATGTPAAVGTAGIEAELLDSITNRRLAAAVDRRVGKKSFDVGMFQKWSDVQEAYDYWAEKLAERLQELRVK